MREILSREKERNMSKIVIKGLLVLAIVEQNSLCTFIVRQTVLGAINKLFALLWGGHGLGEKTVSLGGDGLQNP